MTSSGRPDPNPFPEPGPPGQAAHDGWEFSSELTADPQVEGRFGVQLARLRVAWSGFRGAWTIFVASRIGVLGLVIIAAFALFALAHPILMNTVWDRAMYDPITGYGFDEIEHPARPSPTHLLGTDSLGRDVLSQLMSSAGSEFLLGITAAVVTVTIATTIGAVSAYYGGVVDALLMRLADIIIMLPTISLLIVLTALFGLNLLQLALVLGVLAGFGGTAIVLKSQALSIKVKPYIEAAAGGRRRAPAHHLRPHRAQPAAPVAALHDVHRQSLLRAAAPVGPGLVAFRPAAMKGDETTASSPRRCFPTSESSTCG